MLIHTGVDSLPSIWEVLLTQALEAQAGLEGPSRPACQRKADGWERLKSRCRRRGVLGKTVQQACFSSTEVLTDICFMSLKARRHVTFSCSDLARLYCTILKTHWDFYNKCALSASTGSPRHGSLEAGCSGGACSCSPARLLPGAMSPSLRRDARFT